MAGVSRTYKLRLSAQGFDLFLDCHHRLARLTRAFVPYGTTLYTAVTALDTLETCDVAAELAGPRCAAVAGKQPYFVGFSNMLAERLAAIAARIVAADECADPPSTTRLCLAALICLESAEDDHVLRAYDAASVSRLPRRADSGPRSIKNM